jgi:hypothetical protein
MQPTRHADPSFKVEEFEQKLNPHRSDGRHGGAVETPSGRSPCTRCECAPAPWAPTAVGTRTLSRITRAWEPKRPNAASKRNGADGSADETPDHRARTARRDQPDDPRRTDPHARDGSGYVSLANRQDTPAPHVGQSPVGASQVVGCGCPCAGAAREGPMISAAIAADQCMENQPSIPAQCRPQPVSTNSLPPSIRPSTIPGSEDLRNFDIAAPEPAAIAMS